MSDSDMEIIREDEHSHLDEGLEEDDGKASTKTRDVPFLTGLNLVLLVSYLSLSGDECLNLEDTEKIQTDVTQEPKENVSRLRAEKRKLPEPKFEKRVQRVQTKVRDCRHNRRM